MSPNMSSLQETVPVGPPRERRAAAVAHVDRVPSARKAPKTVQANGAPVRSPAPAAGNQHEPVGEFLSHDEYSQWDQFVDKSPHGTVFHYSWWLEAASSQFKLLAVRDEKGRIVAGLPLPLRRRAGLRLLHSPALTPYLGPIFDISGADNTCDQLHLMRKYGEALGNHIGTYDSLRYVAGALAPDLQGLIWAGFRVGLSSYTFRFPAGLSSEDVRSAMTRTHLQKLDKALSMNVSIARDGDINELIALNAKTFERQNLAVPYDLDLVRRLWAAASAHGNARLYVVKAKDGTPVSALFTVNDHKTTYQIVSGVDTTIKNVPGAYLTLWHAIQDALAAGRAFDFEGSGIRGVETFYRRWGAMPWPVWRIEKCNSWRGALLQFVLERRHQVSRSQSRS